MVFVLTCGKSRSGTSQVPRWYGSDVELVGGREERGIAEGQSGECGGYLCIS
jgi:hypothetical protein